MRLPTTDPDALISQPWVASAKLTSPIDGIAAIAVGSVPGVLVS